jgi:hypothetical protein
MKLAAGQKKSLPPLCPELADVIVWELPFSFQCTPLYIEA